jgi:hypothetical protein
MVNQGLAGLGLAIAVLAAAPCAAQPAEHAAVTVALDQERTVGDIGVACTGVGQTKADPHWLSYSVRLEFADPAREYLANEAVAVSDASGRELAAVKCEGPWILFKLPPGAYKATGWLPGSPLAPASASFRAPAKGQLRLVLQFPAR